MDHNMRTRTRGLVLEIDAAKPAANKPVSAKALKTSPSRLLPRSPVLECKPLPPLEHPLQLRHTLHPEEHSHAPHDWTCGVIWSIGQKNVNMLTQAEVIALLRARPKVATRYLVKELRKKLKKDVVNKYILGSIIKKVVIIQDGVRLLKEGF
ncbi:MAG: hypothetical protein J3R72DRAFT_516952 [Linnemannia gamsii]|nr:MAG: hypothetical protein J3R72DRAFT_516952 [Linnemannia gamsii]